MLKSFYISVFILLLHSSCTHSTKDNFQTIPAFQSMIDSIHVNGSILIYDVQKNTYFLNNFDWAKQGKMPASTFKITNSIIGLETAVIKSDQDVFHWNGEKRAMKRWEQDLSLHQAFHLSCVPCYQEVARTIGVQQMNQYVTKLNYGKMVVDSASIDMFWLQGNSKISQLEQIDFLTRLYQSKLPISKRTEKIMKKLMVIEENEDFILSGKTGWSTKRDLNLTNGWFVGYVEIQDKVYFVAINLEDNVDQNFDMNTFGSARKNLAYKAFQHLEIIPR